ncbi:hypothetical protein PENTCL1PPCAC_29890, partial [Pristionchus entomophagus]
VLLSLPAFALAITDCNGDPSLGCFDDTDCDATATDGKCTGGDQTTFVLGCCGTLATTTTAATVTTVASNSGSGTGSGTGSSTTCVDKLNPVTGTSDCGPKAYLCSDANYRQVMIDQCPRTCGFCSSSSSSSSSSGTTACVDLVNPRTGVSDCPSLRAYCTNAVYLALMKVQCRATCGFCTSG